MAIRSKLSKYGLLAIAAIFGLCSTTETQALETIKRKGRFLKKEIIRFDDKTSYNVTLTITESSSFPTFKFTETTLRTIHEIKVFETVVDTINTNVQDAQNIKDYRALKILPNEYIKDDPTTRDITVVEGPFANAPFTINGKPIVTDKDGLYVDANQELLAQFDNLNINALDVTVAHAKHGEKHLQLTRLIIRQPDKITPDYKHDDPKATLDVLQGMGLDFMRSPNLGRATLNFDCKTPANYTHGDVFPVTLSVTNTSNVTAGNLIFCSFSREEWLDGKLFYIGNLNPGETRSFSRIITAPKTTPTDVSYFQVGSWDAVHAQPDKARTFFVKKKK